MACNELDHLANGESPLFISVFFPFDFTLIWMAWNQNSMVSLVKIQNTYIFKLSVLLGIALLNCPVMGYHQNINHAFQKEKIAIKAMWY